MIHFKNEEIIFADNGEPIKIIRLLSVGGYGEVYEVEYKGEIKAFKYFTNINAWHRDFARLRSSILTYECGNEIFSKNKSDLICDSCGKQLELKFRIDFDRYSIIAQPGVRLYKCQFDSGIASNPPGQELYPAMLVVANENENNMLGLKNVSSVDFVGETPSGKKRIIHPGSVVTLKKGIRINAFDSLIQIDEM